MNAEATVWTNEGSTICLELPQHLTVAKCFVQRLALKRFYFSHPVFHNPNPEEFAYKQARHCFHHNHEGLNFLQITNLMLRLVVNDFWKHLPEFYA
jgi:hypothetical protein